MSNEPTQEQKQSFLNELTELTLKHGLKVNACCQGIWLESVSKTGHYSESVEWIDDTPIPEGYKLATRREMAKYKKPTDYRYLPVGATYWHENMALDGEWVLDGGEYVVREDHVWELKETKHMHMTIDTTAEVE